MTQESEVARAVAASQQGSLSCQTVMPLPWHLCTCEPVCIAIIALSCDMRPPHTGQLVRLPLLQVEPSRCIFCLSPPKQVNQHYQLHTKGPATNGYHFASHPTLTHTRIKTQAHTNTHTPSPCNLHKVRSLFKTASVLVVVQAQVPQCC